jgi:hypothetical protein
MPRKSAAEALVSAAVPQKIRPDAHYDLRDDEAAVWRVVVDTMPADWFNAAQQFLLARFCKAVVTARKVDDDLAFEEGRKRPNRSVVRQLRSMQAGHGRHCAAGDQDADRASVFLSAREGGAEAGQGNGV